MAQLDDIISALNDNTNTVAARLDKLVQELAQNSQAPSAGQLASLQSIADHLKALGADPTNPIPGSQVSGVTSSGDAATTTATASPPAQAPATEPAASTEPTATPTDSSSH